jgi:hypothetical protein
MRLGCSDLRLGAARREARWSGAVFAMLTLATLPIALLAPHAASATSPFDVPKIGYVANLSYSTGAISVFSVSNGVATLTKKFSPVNTKTGSVNGIMLHGGLIYTAINSSSSKPCASCLEVFGLDGTLKSRQDAPTISGAPGAPDITDLAVDAKGDVFLSDFGQQAVYYYSPSKSGWSGPNVVVSGSTNAASVAVVPDANVVYISGGCGFASARVYTRQSSGGYQSGNCFSIPTIALIGASVDAAGDVASPVDGAPGLVAIVNPNGKGVSFTLPTFKDGVGGVTFAQNDMALYVADATKEIVYAYRRPDGGWTKGRKPRLAATYTGFAALNIIAEMR